LEIRNKLNKCKFLESGVRSPSWDYLGVGVLMFVCWFCVTCADSYCCGFILQSMLLNSQGHDLIVRSVVLE